MAEIVGVHGIMNQQSGRHQLIAEWGPAIADGMERAAGRAIAPPRFDIAFYGDLYLDRPQPPSKGLALEEEPPKLRGISDEELDDLTAAVDEAAGPDEVGEESETKGFLSNPQWVQWSLRRLDRAFGSRTSAILYLGALRQVRQYLCTSGIKAEADARVEAAVSGECRVLVGHSLGSVVALEYLRKHPEHRFDLFLTVGSPLGLQTVRRLMPDVNFSSDHLPANVDRWVNLWDRGDPVACVGDLTQWWPGIEDDDSINNEMGAHSVSRYLSKRQVGRALLTALPTLTGDTNSNG